MGNLIQTLEKIGRNTGVSPSQKGSGWMMSENRSVLEVLQILYRLNYGPEMAKEVDRIAPQLAPEGAIAKDSCCCGLAKG